jgi:hypothetical protein
MADDVNRELAHAAPLRRDAIELGAVGYVELRLPGAELGCVRISVAARRERVADALDDGIDAVHDVGDRLRAFGAAERRRETQQRLHGLIAGGSAWSTRRERQALGAIGFDAAEREAQRAARLRGIG